MNEAQQRFYQSFANNLITELKTRHPGFRYQLSFNHQMPLDRIDLTEFSTIDYHLWMEDSGGFKHLNKPIADRDQRVNLPDLDRQLLSVWRDGKREMTSWMRQQITRVAASAKANKISWGNTEGWGFICWMDHPELHWTIIKEAGEISIDLVREHEGLLFCCTSNFTHLHFTGLWRDVEWHRRLTSRIRS